MHGGSRYDGRSSQPLGAISTKALAVGVASPGIVQKDGRGRDSEEVRVYRLVKLIIGAT